MRYFYFLILIIIIPLCTLGQETQSCKVIVPNLDGKYFGECKKGLADGQGSARGIHIYEGEFNKGYPHGEGKYIWAGDDYYEGTFKKGKRNGYGKHYMIIDGKYVLTEGFWENDVYIGKEKKVQNYSTDLKAGIKHVFYNYKGIDASTNEIMIVFKKGNNESKSIVSDPSIEGSSGNLIDLEEKYGFENVAFPFKAKLSFNAPNETKPEFTSATLNFEIMKEGSWDVIIYY